MTRHNGYGATRGSGRLPQPSFTVAWPGANPRENRELIELAIQMKRVAIKCEMPVSEAVAKARAAGVIECDDEDARLLTEVAEGLRP